jgi:hydroxyethylthiazole kinase-like sugar kinase family protein
METSPQKTVPDFDLEALITEDNAEQIAEEMELLKQAARNLVARVINGGIDGIKDEGEKRVVTANDSLVGDIVFSQPDFVESVGGTFANDRINLVHASVAAVLPEVLDHIDTIHTLVRREVVLWQKELRKKYLVVV